MIIKSHGNAGFSPATPTTRAATAPATSFGAVLKQQANHGADMAAQLDDYMKLTPAERIRVDLLKKLGLTEEEMAAKPPEERASLELKLRDLVKEQMEKASRSQHTVKPAVGQWIDTVA